MAHGWASLLSRKGVCFLKNIEHAIIETVEQWHQQLHERFVADAATVPSPLPR